MLNVSIEDIQRTVSQLGEGDRRDTEIEIAVRRFAADPLTVRRLIDWTPEAFGYVLLPHVADLVLPASFTARAKDGSWREFAFDREPIFQQAVTIATGMYRDSRAIFSQVARRSAMVKVVNDALNEGRSLTGATIAGPAMIAIPAEFYDAKPKAAGGGFWRKLVG